MNTGAASTSKNMELRGKKLGQIFVELGLIDEDQMKAALAYAQQWGVPFGRACVKMGFLDDDLVVRALAVQSGAPSVTLSGIEVPRAVLDILPAKYAEKHRAIPITLMDPLREGVKNPTPGGRGRRTLVLAVGSQKDLHSLDEIAFVTGCKISLVIAGDQEITDALMRFYGVEIDRHMRTGQMVDFESMDENGDPLVSRDPLEFLPSVEIQRHK